MNKNITLTFAARFAAPATSQDGPRRFSGIAYSGGIVPDYWQGDVAVDIAGLTLPDGDLPILNGHMNALDAICGKGRVRIENHAILIDGELADTEAGRTVASLADATIPLQLSVGLYQTSVEEFGGKTRAIKINGQTLQLHAVIRSGTLREVSFTPLGADPNTEVTVFTPATPAPKGAEMDLQARIDELEAENQALKDAALAATHAARETEVRALFSATGREFTPEAAKPYLGMEPATFAAVAADLKAARPVIDPKLTQERAKGDPAETTSGGAINLSAIYAARQPAK